MDSQDDYLGLEVLKMQRLIARVEQAKEDVLAGRTVDGEYFFDNLVEYSLRKK
jgi:hypothetical protein